MDFTLDVLKDLLSTLYDSGYVFFTVNEFSLPKATLSVKRVILRHDVDKKPYRSLDIARLEQELGIRGTFYFRIIPESLDRSIVREIASMGHEVGYHYEDIDLVSRNIKVERQKRPSSVDARKRKEAEMLKLAGGGEKDLAAMAIESFRKNLATLREDVSIDTICMHGSPMSSYDSRILWKYFDYGEMGITAEPYFDFSLDDILYLTDTGRRWDGSAVSVRDRVYSRGEEYFAEWVRKPVKGSAMAMTIKGEALRKRYIFRDTNDILGAARLQNLPGTILFTLHPQRWSDSFPEWIAEFLGQNMKNQVKYFMIKWK